MCFAIILGEFLLGEIFNNFTNIHRSVTKKCFNTYIIHVLLQMITNMKLQPCDGQSASQAAGVTELQTSLLSYN